jgi:hypothetical protein
MTQGEAETKSEPPQLVEKKYKNKKKTSDSCVARRAEHFEIPLGYVQHATSKVIRFYKLRSN